LGSQRREVYHVPAVEVALSPFYVETLVRSGELPALKLCQHYTILREDIDAFLHRKRAELDR
jgi:excisionase family DNA binding protein